MNALDKISYGLYIVSSTLDGKDNACINNSFGLLTAQPEVVFCCVNKESLTHDMIQKSGLFTVSVIDQTADFDLFRHFGFHSGRDTDKFSDFSDFRRDENGVVYVTQSTNAFVSAKVLSSQDLGTHTLFIAKVCEKGELSNHPSATYEFYHAKIKPKGQATQAAGAETVWQCKICGYKYVGETLPPDYICPLCKHPASDFEKLEPST